MTISSGLVHNDISTASTSTQNVPWKMGDPSSFQDLFSSGIATDPTTATAAPAAPPQTPVALTSPSFEQNATVTAPDGTFTNMNPMEMASEATAEELAAKLGGTVSTENFAGGFSTSAPIRDISFSNTNVKISAGIAASLFAMYGDAQGSQAWQTINNDLGRDPSATGPVS